VPKIQTESKLPKELFEDFTKRFAFFAISAMLALIGEVSLTVEPSRGSVRKADCFAVDFNFD